MIPLFGKRYLGLFTITLLGSALLHGLVIVYLKFETPIKHWMEDPTANLEVILVNSQSKHRPKQPSKLAQVNQIGGGNTLDPAQISAINRNPDDSTRYRNPTHEIQVLQMQLNELNTQASQKKARLAELEREAQTLMTQLDSNHRVLTNPSTTRPSHNPQRGKDAQSNLTEQARLRAQIAKTNSQLQQNPKREAVGANTRAYRYARYVEHWRTQIEHFGTLNYPEEAKEKGIYGQLQLSISIRANGSIEKVIINHSSGSSLLDNAAIHILKLSAPFDAFPEGMREEIDVLTITRTFMFTRESRLITESTPH
jgi:periplasmic protein TonB